MKLLRKLSGQGWLSICGIALAGWFFTGCGTTYSEPTFTTNAPTEQAVVNGDQTQKVIFHIGDTVTVVFSDTPEPIQAHEERIDEHGMITLPLIGAVKAAGKTPGDLQKDIHDLYVPKYYVRITITVKYQSVELVYYVGGEVKSPGRFPYLGQTTVTKAIQSAGDFNDFANKKKVRLTRADRKTTIIVNCKDIQNNKAIDPIVLPGDKIDVPRRWW